MINNENAFKEWFRVQTHDGGKPYAESTQTYYISALRFFSKELSDKIQPYVTIFDVDDIDEFQRIRNIIETNEEKKERFLEYGGGSLKPSLDLYQKFLQEKLGTNDSIDIDTSLEKELKDISLDNKKWIFLCLEKLKEHNILTHDVLTQLTDIEFCKREFKLYYTAVLTVDVSEDAKRRVYNDKFILSDGSEYWVASEWYLNNVEQNVFNKSKNNRSIFTNWVIKKLREKINSITYITNVKSEYSLNRIVFGAPGTGKSHQLAEETEKLIGSNRSPERVTFHPDYTYANFVGCYKPVPKDDSLISYEYVPGPFMRMLVKALKDTDNAHLLIVEEINRANVAAVFGDIFQLLDRNKVGESEYEIQTSEDMRKYLAKELSVSVDKVANIKIPNNLFLWATMNSADQGVYPMDTAFKRRWDFEYIDIDNGESEIADYNFTVNGTTINWNALRKAINKQLTEIGINEDKLMGAFFIAKYIIDENNDEKFIDTFCNKVIMYLFEDAARQKSNRIFNLGNGKARYSMLCNDFRKKGLNIFVDAVKSEYERLTNQEGAQG